ncbi:MAG: nucleotidyltransferase domain-containing protein [Deltaproteobacteria bacterium]|nr:nucleotidyltransferase domain-containing protein [Deltaproteobacteria bacterium]
MRLSFHEQQVIKETIRRFDPSARIYLYGSRARPELKGGDIDLLVISDQLVYRDKITILVEIKTALGEQKIDLLLKNTTEEKTDPFVIQILPEAVELS